MTDWFERLQPAPEPEPEPEPEHEPAKGPDLFNPLFEGIPNIPTGSYGPSTFRDWTRVVAVLMARGVSRPETVSALCGFTVKEAGVVIERVLEAWTSAVAQVDVLEATAVAVHRFEAIAQGAHAIANAPESTGAERVRALALAKNATESVAKLFGAGVERLDVRVSGAVHTVDVNAMLEKAEARGVLDLTTVGDQLAVALSEDPPDE